MDTTTTFEDYKKERLVSILEGIQLSVYVPPLLAREEANVLLAQYPLLAATLKKIGWDRPNEYRSIRPWNVHNLGKAYRRHHNIDPKIRPEEFKHLQSKIVYYGTCCVCRLNCWALGIFIYQYEDRDINGKIFNVRFCSDQCAYEILTKYKFDFAKEYLMYEERILEIYEKKLPIIKEEPKIETLTQAMEFAKELIEPKVEDLPDPMDDKENQQPVGREVNSIVLYQPPVIDLVIQHPGSQEDVDPCISAETPADK